MITYQRIGRYLTAEPFRPFRITLAGGRTFDIRHPEMVQVGRTTMTISLFEPIEGGDPREREIDVSLLLTESVEPLDATAAKAEG